MKEAADRGAGTESTAPHVLVMDGNERNVELIGEVLDEAGYETVSATDLDAARRLIEDPSPIGFAIVDVDRFPPAVWDRCRDLAEADVPFIVLSGVADGGIDAQSRQEGARSFVEKPISKRTLLDIVKGAVRTSR